MNSITAMNVARQRFDQYVKQPQELVVAYDNAPIVTPPPATVWARLAIRSGDTEQMSLGANKRFRTMCLMIIQVFAPIGKGDKKARDIIDLIASGVIEQTNQSLFRSVKADGLTWRTPSVTNVGASGKWWQFNVTCPFYYEDIETAAL